MRETFNLDREAAYSVTITDQTGTYIDPDDLIDIVDTYNTGEFTVKLTFTRKAATNNYVTVPNALQVFVLSKEEGRNLFDEIERTGKLADRSRIKLVKYLADYVLLLGEGSYTASNLRSVVRAASTVFPYLKGGPNVDIECVVSVQK